MQNTVRQPGLFSRPASLEADEESARFIRCELCEIFSASARLLHARVCFSADFNVTAHHVPPRLPMVCVCPGLNFTVASNWKKAAKETIFGKNAASDQQVEHFSQDDGCK